MYVFNTIYTYIYTCDPVTIDDFHSIYRDVIEVLVQVFFNLSAVIYPSRAFCVSLELDVSTF